MKNKFAALFCALAASALSASNASAIVYGDLDVFNGTVGQLVNATHPLTGTFNIATQDHDGIFDLVGYNPAKRHITRAIAEFLIFDDSLTDAKEKVTITLGSSTFVNNRSADYLLKTHGIEALARLDLSDDGILDYTIIATKGDFRVAYGVLTAVARRNNVVPDSGSTALLLGASLAGLAVLPLKRKTGLNRA